MSQIGERVHKGGGVKSKIKKFYISNVDFFDFGFDPAPPYGLFPQFGTFSFWNAPLTNFLRILDIVRALKPGRSLKLPLLHA